MIDIIGTQQKFTYPNFESPDSYPEYTAHSGQIVTVMDKLAPPEVDEEVNIYTIKAEDGWEGQAHLDELTELNLLETEKLIPINKSISAKGLKRAIELSATIHGHIMQNIPDEVYLLTLQYLHSDLNEALDIASSM
jgi:hypothetical protein